MITDTKTTITGTTPATFLTPSTYRFTHRLRVRWVEVDMQKIVFNAHYLMYLDTAISDYWRALAMPYAVAMADLGGDLYVKKATLQYHGSAHFDDQIDVALRCERIGTSSITFAGLISRAGAPLVTAELVYVFANPVTQTSLPVPAIFRQMLNAFEAGETMAPVQLGPWKTLEVQAASVRQAVFVQELGVDAALEWDLADLTALHAVAINGLGQAIGTARMSRQGPGTVRIGRLAVVRALRGAGFGRQLLQALEQAAGARGDREVTLHAQCSAQGFYERLGYLPRGNVFDEAGLPHMDMVKQLTSPIA